MRKKEDEKGMSPMFPRVYVNNSEKRGAWAPPRNPMVANGQSSVSSKGHNSTSTSTWSLPLNQIKSNTVVGTQEGNMARAMDYPSLSVKGSLNQKSRKYVRGQCEEDGILSLSCHNLHRSGSITSPTDRGLAGRSSSSSSKVTNYESLKKRLRPPVNQEIRIDSVKALNSMALRDNLWLECSGRQDRPERTCGVEQITGVDRRDDVSQSFMMSSESKLPASPDDVIRLIGKIKSWKLRTTMINQQTIFTSQVFELHRLIKVQKLLAGSPGLFLKGDLSRGKPITVKESSSVLESASFVTPNNRDSQKSKPRIELSDEHIIQKLPLPSISQKVITLPSDPMPPNKKPSPWSFQEPANQWLVPVMSPSEGLVYKPYTGPIYGNNFFSAAFGHPKTFPPYEMQVPNSLMLSSRDEQMSAFSETRSSCSMLSHMTQAIPCGTRKSQVSRDSDGQASTASSPPARPKLDLLPLFPTETTYQHTETEESEQQPVRAIKVAPYDLRSASESAARIFRSILEERKHYD